MTINDLTDLEKIVLQASMAFWNYGTRDEKFDNAVVFNAKDLAGEIEDLSISQIKGVMGSLHKKGLFWDMECGDMGQFIESGISEEGIDLACDLCEAVLDGEI